LNRRVDVIFSGDCRAWIPTDVDDEGNHACIMVAQADVEVVMRYMTLAGDELGTLLELRVSLGFCTG
jgi:hypothetical protein